MTGACFEVKLVSHAECLPQALKRAHIFGSLSGTTQVVPFPLSAQQHASKSEIGNLTASKS
jgi:hypothetical protein